MMSKKKKAAGPPAVVPAPTFGQKRKAWLKQLVGKDPNSVSNQLAWMTWWFASFNVINEARRIAPVTSDGHVKLNGLTHELITHGFFVGQAMAARRLADGDGNVFSLKRMLKEMIANIAFFTRKNMLRADQLPYHYGRFERQEHEYSQKHYPDGGAHTPQNFGKWHEARHRHEVIDKLVRVRADQRQPDDTIPVSLFQDLLTKLDLACERIRIYANKFVAHAATPSSRKKAGVKPLRLIDLKRANKCLCEIAAFLANHVLGSSFASGVAHPIYNQFEHIDKPLVATEKISELRGKWNEFSRETEGWGLWSPDDSKLTIEEREHLAFQAAGRCVSLLIDGALLANNKLHARDRAKGNWLTATLAGKLAGFWHDTDRKPGGRKASTKPDGGLDFAILVLGVYGRNAKVSEADYREVVDRVLNSWSAIEKLAAKFNKTESLTDAEIRQEVSGLVR